jgi:hypothetical protein
MSVIVLWNERNCFQYLNFFLEIKYTDILKILEISQENKEIVEFLKKWSILYSALMGGPS